MKLEMRQLNMVLLVIDDLDKKQCTQKEGTEN